MECDRLLPVDGKPCFHYVRDCEGQPGFCQLSDRFRCIKAVEFYAPRLSYSSIENWKTCKRLYMLNNIYGLRLRPKFLSPSLLNGSIMDKVMEKAWADGYYDLESSLFIINSHIYTKVISEYDKAKLRALAVALDSMGFKPLRSECQKETLFHIVGGHTVMAKMDAVPDKSFFVEFKYTGYPDRYLEVYNIEDQVGMYFASDPALQFVVMAPIRNPELKIKTTKKKGSDGGEEIDPDTYYQKTLDDILSRPSHYFPGWNGTKGRWGKIFYRSEFDLIAIEETAQVVAEEITEAAKKGEKYFYKKRSSCFQYGRECDYFSICKTNAINEIMYTVDLERKKETIWPGQELLEQVRREDAKQEAQTGGGVKIPQAVIEHEHAQTETQNTSTQDATRKEEDASGVKESGGNTQNRENDSDIRGERNRENYELFSDAPQTSPVPAKRAKKPKG